MLHVQSGTFSNFVGCHYWNLNDENVDENSAKPLYTSDGRPNLFILESSLEMGPVGFPGRPVLHEISDTVKLVEKEKLALHEYQLHLEELETDATMEPRANFNWDTVRFWSDYWKSRAFPDCMQILPPAETVEERQFWWETSADLEDTPLRLVMERMDEVRSVAMTLDCVGNLSGRSLGYSEFVRDELSKKSAFQFLPIHGNFSNSFFINFAKFFDSNASYATIFPFDSKEEISRFSASALIGLQTHLYCQDTISRLEPGLVTPEFSLEDLPGGFRKSLTLPIPFPPDLFPGQNVHAAVHAKPSGRRKFLLQAGKALEDFRIAGKLKPGNIEFDDWKALEEVLAEAADEEAGAADDEEDSS